jgi:hypothetical protein
VADEKDFPFEPVQEEDMAAARAQMQDFTIEMLANMREWCDMRIKEKRLTDG